jgi:hypothetical protein
MLAGIGSPRSATGLAMAAGICVFVGASVLLGIGLAIAMTGTHWT